MSENAYFHWVRREIESLLPASATRILEIGCASGATLQWLKARWPEAETFGVEGYGDIEAELAANVDHCLIADLNEPLPDLGRFDLILALDVLEHLADPGRVTAELAKMLIPGGAVIVSVPNVAHYSVAAPLFFRGRFDYADRGILDRTHIRFFTADSAPQLLEDAGLVVEDAVVTRIQGKILRLFDLVTFGHMRRHLAFQFVMKAGRGPRRSFRWRLPPRRVAAA